MRANKKVAKYGPLAAGVSSQFRAAVIERFGACSDSLVGFISMLCGDGHRDALRADDYTFSASSRTTYMASLLVFGTVISDAAMIDRVIGAWMCMRWPRRGTERRDALGGKQIDQGDGRSRG